MLGAPAIILGAPSNRAVKMGFVPWASLAHCGLEVGRLNFKKKNRYRQLFSPVHLAHGLGGLKPWIGEPIRQPTKFK